MVKKRISKRKTDLTKWIGILNQEEYKNLNKNIKIIRKETSRDFERRLKNELVKYLY